MSYEVGSAYLTVLPSMKGFGAAASAQLDPQMRTAGASGAGAYGTGLSGPGAKKGFGAAAGLLGKAFAIGFVVTAAADIAAGIQQYLGDSVTLASDLGETQSKVNEIFGDGAGEVGDFAKTAAKSLGQSEQTALDGAATFGIFGKSAGLAGSDLAGFSTEMSTLASDLASFNNTSPEEAIEAIGSALRGESEPIRKYGVLLDDATLKARAMEMGLISTTKTALTPQQKVLAAQAEILAQTGDAQGDFARTSDQLANKQRMMKAELENVQTEIGTALLPIVTDMVTLFAEEGVPILQEMAAWFTENKDEIKAFALAMLIGGLSILEVLLRMGQGWAMFMDAGITVIDVVTRGFFSFVESLLIGAEKAFGWIPNLGPKLSKAKDQFTDLKKNAEKNLDGMRAGADKVTDGLDAAADGVSDLKSKVEDLNGKTIDINVRLNEYGSNKNYYGGRFTQAPDGRATGGPVVAGRPYIVGEREPELFVPGQSGRIYNQRQLASMGAGSGATINQTNYIDNPDPGAVFAIVDARLKGAMSR